ncbi:Protein PIR [Camellia lanceoleosa]|uniref:Protein PIR n=1 Tax=Camellia lanceoleosa TaxID=1840588 RepID=A0ACC0G8S9_9ERIC|nr:Protein PIR [Camellia lanceoleosa]
MKKKKVLITALEPMITGLQDALPKSIGQATFDGGATELKADVLRGIKEIGSVLYWMGLLDIVLMGKYCSPKMGEIALSSLSSNQQLLQLCQTQGSQIQQHSTPYQNRQKLLEYLEGSVQASPSNHEVLGDQ